MSRADQIEMDGTVEDVSGRGVYRVLLPNGRTVVARLCGKMRLRHIRVVAGDTVRLEVSPYDLTRARYRPRCYSGLSPTILQAMTASSVTPESPAPKTRERLWLALA